MAHGLRWSATWENHCRCWAHWRSTPCSTWTHPPITPQPSLAVDKSRYRERRKYKRSCEQSSRILLMIYWIIRSRWEVYWFHTLFVRLCRSTIQNPTPQPSREKMGGHKEENSRRREVTNTESHENESARRRDISKTESHVIMGTKTESHEDGRVYQRRNPLGHWSPHLHSRNLNGSRQFEKCITDCPWVPATKIWPPAFERLPRRGRSTFINSTQHAHILYHSYPSLSLPSLFIISSTSTTSILVKQV